MDELQLLTELLPPARPPSPETTAAARARMTAGRPPAPRRRAPGWVLAAGAAATAAALAAVTLTGGTAVPTARLSVFRLPAGARVTGVGGPGGPVLLTAARTVARGRLAATGRYWETPAVAGNFLQVGHGDGHYLILETTVNDYFMDTNPSAWSPQVVQQLGVKLASRADRTAWQQAGSPGVFPVNQVYGLADPQSPSAGENYYVRAGRDRLPFVLSATGGSQPFTVGMASMSARQLLGLPANPARLRRLLLKGGDGGWPGGTSSYLFQTVPAVLDLPVTPAVRAALYRMLAGLPGVRSAGQVSDVAGQSGQAVTLTLRYAHCGQPAGGGQWRFSSCVVQQRLVINPASGLPMAQELRYVRLPAGDTWSAPGGLFSYEIFGAPHWTSALPRLNPRGR